MSALNNSLHSLLDDLVAQGAAPGLVAVAFNRDGTFAASAAGSVDTTSSSKPMSVDSVFWLASASKLAVSLVTLVLAEQHVDLDSHAELIEVVPELGQGWEGTKLWQLIDGKDEKGEWKFKEAMEGITLRHILSHTTGSSSPFGTEEGAWLSAEAEKRSPGSMLDGSVENYNTPRLFESGSKWCYGMSVEYLSLFISRLNKTTVRQAFHDLLFSPLSIAPGTLDLYRSSAMEKSTVPISFRGQTSGTFLPLLFGFDIATFEGEPEEGKQPLMSGPLFGTLPAYAQVLQSILHASAPSGGGKPLLTPKMFEQAARDDLTPRGIEIPQRPFLASFNKAMANDVEQWMKPKDETSTEGLGWSLLQASVFKEESSTGLAKGTLSWSGVANTYYFISPEQGIGGIISSQFLPWASLGMLDARDAFETWVVKNAPPSSKSGAEEEDLIDFSEQSEVTSGVEGTAGANGACV